MKNGLLYPYVLPYREKLLAESDKNFEGVTKFSPDEIFPRYFITRPKLLPDFFIPDQNFYPKFYTENKIQIEFFYTSIYRN